jgi:UDP-N-acetylmuramyl pentapeptide synthase
MKVERFRKKHYLIEALQRVVPSEKPVILFKASRSLKLEDVVQPLLAGVAPSGVASAH